MREGKSDELTQNLVEFEKRIECIRNGCAAVKKLSNTILGSGSTPEKYQRKIPQFSAGQAMVESADNMEEGLFKDVLKMVGSTQTDVGAQLANYEMELSENVITALTDMIEEDMKKVDKSRKKLSSARLDMDAALNRVENMEKTLEKAQRELNFGKLEALKAEADEASRKFYTCQDAYATDMLTVLSRERDYVEKLAHLVKIQLAYHKQAVTSLDSLLPHLEKRMNETQERPVFGCPLEEHLKVCKQDIAVVLSTCTTALRDKWMDTEGLFRLAAGAAKIKYLKSSFDAGQKDVSDHDPHTIAGCIKMYLRELPEPLLKFELYSEWLKAAGIGDSNERLQAIWKVKQKLPKQNLDNLKYLIMFCKELVQHSEATKMGASNIAIVIGPNLLWQKENEDDPGSVFSGLMVDTAMQTRLVETMIECCDWLFQDSQDENPPTPTTPPSTITTTTTKPTNELKSSSMEGLRRPPPQTTERLVKTESAPTALQLLPPPPSKPQRAPGEDVTSSPPIRPIQRPPPVVPRSAPPTPPRPYSEEKTTALESSKLATQVESRGVPPPPARSGEDGPRPLPTAARPRPSVRIPKKPEMSAPSSLSENNVPTEIMFVIDGEVETPDGEVASSPVTEADFTDGGTTSFKPPDEEGTRKRNAARDSMYSKARSPARPAPLPPPAIPKRAPTTTATATNEESIL